MRFLPVVDATVKVCGLVTYREACTALGERNVAASGVQVGEVNQRAVRGCSEDDPRDAADVEGVSDSSSWMARPDSAA
jgi:hypothetical protein